MRIAPETLHSLLLAPGELALLDVREARQAFGAHLALARHAPLSGLELLVQDFVPRRTTPVVLYDASDRDDGPAAVAQSLLTRWGWSDVRRLHGGLAAWTERGFPTIDGYGALVKSFGDLARQHFATPTISSGDLERRLRGGQPTRLIDVRPAAEYAFLSIAGARNYAGTELALRQLPVPDAEPLWAINCFSRTRGIIGATTLKLLGCPRVAFVEDGVMAWELLGLPVTQDAGAADDMPAGMPDELRARARALTRTYGLSRIGADTLAEFRADDRRSLYLFDLRPAPSPDDRPAAGARRVPGGQLLMHFEQLVGTRGARVVLLDDPHGLRAAVTAFWLTQFNQAEIHMFDGPLPAPAPEVAPVSDERALAVDALVRLLDAGPAVVIDVGPSAEYEGGHLPGAHYLLPSSLEPARALLAASRPVVFTSPDGAAARIAARDAGTFAEQVFWLKGGTAAWRAAGQPLETSHAPARLLTPFDDDFGSVMRVAGPRRHDVWLNYLAWERGVAARIARDETVRFEFFHPEPDATPAAVAARGIAGPAGISTRPDRCLQTDVGMRDRSR